MRIAVAGCGALVEVKGFGATEKGDSAMVEGIAGRVEVGEVGVMVATSGREWQSIGAKTGFPIELGELT